MSDNSVISTRVRLARNLKDFPFPCKLSPDGMEKVIEKVRSAVKNSNSSIASDFMFIKMSDLTEAMGINSPSLYAAFGSKEELYRAAIHHFAAIIDAARNFGAHMVTRLNVVGNLGQQRKDVFQPEQ